MPNLVNEILLDELQRDFQRMGSCLVLSFDKLTVADATALRNRFRENGLRYRVVKNRLAVRAFRGMNLDMAAAFRGKCGIVIAEQEHAIGAAKLVREAMKKVKEPPVVVIGGVIEGEAITGTAAQAIADFPDRQTVRTQIVRAISGPARALAVCVQGLNAGLARVVQARIDAAGGSIVEGAAPSGEGAALGGEGAAPSGEIAAPGGESTS